MGLDARGEKPGGHGPRIEEDAPLRGREFQVLEVGEPGDLTGTGERTGTGGEGPQARQAEDGGEAEGLLLPHSDAEDLRAGAGGSLDAGEGGVIDVGDEITAELTVLVGFDRCGVACPSAGVRAGTPRSPARPGRPRSWRCRPGRCADEGVPPPFGAAR
ncbi:hypothetical protein GCM10010415_17640 [Streptomyces atrovirens]